MSILQMITSVPQMIMLALRMIHIFVYSLATGLGSRIACREIIKICMSSPVEDVRLVAYSILYRLSEKRIWIVKEVARYILHQPLDSLNEDHVRNFIHLLSILPHQDDQAVRAETEKVKKLLTLFQNSEAPSLG